MPVSIEGRSRRRYSRDGDKHPWPTFTCVMVKIEASKRFATSTQYASVATLHRTGHAKRLHLMARSLAVKRAFQSNSRSEFSQYTYFKIIALRSFEFQSFEYGWEADLRMRSAAEVTRYRPLLTSFNSNFVRPRCGE
jgi:hypothetical protein